MTTPKFSIAPLEQRLAAAQDSVLLRVTLVLAYQQQGELAAAVPHLVKATELAALFGRMASPRSSLCGPRPGCESACSLSEGSRSREGPWRQAS